MPLTPQICIIILRKTSEYSKTIYFYFTIFFLKLYDYFCGINVYVMKKAIIKIKRFDKSVPLPQIIEEGDWIDLYCAETTVLHKNEQKLIPLGVGMILPNGMEGWLLPRSSTAKKFGIIMANNQGIIDHTFCGEVKDDRSSADEWKFNAYALRDTTVQKGDRIAQFRIALSQMASSEDKLNWLISSGVQIEEVESLSDVVRGGHGHTGHKELMK